MKRFLTRKEACRLINKLKGRASLEEKEKLQLESIRVCLVGDAKGMSLWGKEIEPVRPIFRECDEPGKNPSEEETLNYAAYKEDLFKAEKIAKGR